MKKQPLTTDLVGEKTLKTDEKIEFFGQIDELSSLIMEFTHYIDDKNLEMQLRKIVSVLTIASAEIAGGCGHLGELYLNELTEVLDFYNEKVGPFKCFVLPGETLKGAKAHILRTVCRRVERAYARVYEKYKTSEIIFEYLNKLSSLFFAIARLYDEN